MAKSLSEHVVFLKTFFPLLISTQSVAFWYNFYTSLYFVNQRNYKH
jgi:hypothetical protein